MNERGFSVILKIRHASLDPEVLTRELGLVPEHSWKAGDPRPPELGPSTHDTFRETYWVAPIQNIPYSEALPETSVVNTLLFAALMLKRRQALWAAIQDGGQAELLVSLSTRDGFTLDIPAKTLAILGGIGLSISFEHDEDVAAAA